MFSQMLSKQFMCRRQISGSLLFGFFGLFWLAFVVAPHAPAQTARPLRASYLSVAEAQPVLTGLAQALPAELGNLTPVNRAPLWNQWVTRQDALIRARLAQGDEDSLVNLLLFGTSFTKQPRLTEKQIARFGADNKVSATAFQTRLDDFVAALVKPGNNERILFARQMLVERKRVVAPNQFLKMLDRVAKNDVYLNMARDRAAQMAANFRAPAAATAEGK